MYYIEFEQASYRSAEAPSETLRAELIAANGSVIVETEISADEPSTEAVWEFHWDCGRMGNVEALFVATYEEISSAIGKNVYFGEILGKHSEIYGTLDKEDLKVVSLIPECVSLIRCSPSGHNPLEYLEEDEEE